MFNLGDYVFHQKTGNIGKVIGYGHQILDTGYETTLKVLVAESQTCKKRGFVAEDLYSVWVQWPNEKYFSNLLQAVDLHLQEKSVENAVESVQFERIS